MKLQNHVCESNSGIHNLKDSMLITEKKLVKIVLMVLKIIINSCQKTENCNTWATIYTIIYCN